MASIANLDAKITVTGAAEGAAALDKLADAGGKAEDAANKTSDAWSKAARKIAGDTGGILDEIRQLNVTQLASATSLQSLNAGFVELSQTLRATLAANTAVTNSTAVVTQALAQEATAAKETAGSFVALGSAANSLGSAGGAAAALANIASSANLAKVAALGVATGLASVRPAAAAVSGAAAPVADLSDALARATAQISILEGRVTSLQSSLGKTGTVTESAKASFNSLAAGQKLTGYQTQQLSYQLNDLFVQVASGQSPITALIQQGSQLNGTFGGIGGTLRAVASIFTVTNVAIAAAAAVVGAVGYGFYQASQQAEEFRKSIALTGNAAGITRGQFVQMATDIATATQTSVGSTRDTLQTLVASGQFAGTALTSATTAVQGFAKATGESTDKVAASFVKGAGSVSTFADTLNQQYHFLSASQTQAIKDAQDQGDSTKALTILFDALNNRLVDVNGNTNSLARGFGALKTAALNLKDSFVGLFDDVTPEKKLADLKKQLADLQKPAPTGRSGITLDTFGGAGSQRSAGNIDTLTAAIAAQQKLVEGAQGVAKAKAAGVIADQASTELAKKQDQFQTNKQKRTKELGDLDAIYAKSNKTAADQQNLADAKAGVINRYKDPKTPNTQRRDDNAEFRNQLEDIKAAGDVELKEYQNQDKVLEARHAALLIRDKEYYDEKNRIAQAGIAAQIATLELENKALAGRTGLNPADASNRDREIKANNAKIKELQDAARTQTTNSNTQQEFAIKKTKDALDDARQAAQSYLDVQQRSYDLAILGLSVSDRQAQGLAGIASIQEKYEAQRQSLEADRRRQQISPETYQTELAIINEFQAKSIQSYTSYYDKTLQLAQDSSAGAQKAVANYLDDAANIYKQTNDLVTSAFKGTEDALVSFVTTGKLSFKSLANSIIADLARIAIKTAATSLFGGGSSGGGLLSLLSLGGTSLQASAASTLPGDSLDNFINIAGLAGGRASGGPVDAGSLYRVNENGPELLNVAGKQYLMMGGQSGSVTPNGGGAGSRGVQIVNQTKGRIDDARVSSMDDGQMAIVISQAEDRIINGLRDPNGRPYAAVQSSFKVQPNR